MKPGKKEIPKINMMTSQEVYNRIMWDGKLNPKAFIIGFTDRVSESGLREKPLIEWAADGDIPWHRVRYIRCGQEMVWDRDNRINLFENDSLPEEAWTKEDDKTVYSGNLFFQRSIYSFNQTWKEYSGSNKSSNIHSIKVLTWNVLFDQYHQELIRTSERIPAIVEQIKTCDADIVLLQEATPALLKVLQETAWCKNYYCSENEDGKSLNYHGLLILSKYPFHLLEYSFSEQKRFFAAEWNFNEYNFHSALVHLTSNRSAKAEDVRREQVDVVLRYLNSVDGTALIAGDFNTRNENTLDVLLANKFEDIWLKQYPEEPGYTFDPARNPIAKINSLSGLQGRLDRMLLRTTSGEVKATSIQMIGDSAIHNTSDLFPSDHFGLLATFQIKEKKTENYDLNVLAKIQELKPVYKSGIVVIPDKKYWPQIQAVRKQCDSSYERWMPHITLIYGFIPDDYFSDAAPIIASEIKQIQPFEVTLAEYHSFTHNMSYTAMLKPDKISEEKLIRLQTVIQNLFPNCAEQISRYGSFHPHMTIGKFETKETMLATLPPWKEMTFPVTKISMISRKANEPFIVHYTIDLSSGKIEAINDTATSDSLEYCINQLFEIPDAGAQVMRKDVLNIVEQACSEVLGQTTALNLLGSSRLGIQSKTGDSDVLCLIPEGLTHVEFLESLKSKLDGLYEKARVVIDAQVPVLRLQIEGIAVDVLCANNPFFPSGINSILEEEYYRFDPVSWQALNGCLEAQKILAVASSKLPVEKFRMLVKAIRLWAKNRKIVSNSWGFPGNFSWTLMSTCAIASLPDPDKYSSEDLFKHCLKYFYAHDFKIPMALTEEGKKNPLKSKRDRMPVVTSVKPYANSTRNMTGSTAKVVKDELKNSLDQLKLIEQGKMNWDAFFNSGPLSAESSAKISIELFSKNKEALETAMGWVDGHVIGLIIGLEQEAHIRPFYEWEFKTNEAFAFLYYSGNRNEDAINSFYSDFLLEKMINVEMKLI